MTGYPYRREENPLESLLRWRRNVFLALPGDETALLYANEKIITARVFGRNLRADPLRSVTVGRRADLADLHDGRGWNLDVLQGILGDLLTGGRLLPQRNFQMQQRKPYTGFYSVEMREAIRHLDANLLRLWTLLATFAGPDGVCNPSQRALAEILEWHVESVSDGLDELERLGMLIYLRKNQRDPLTRQMLSNVYALSPELLLTPRPVDQAFPVSLIHVFSQIRIITNNKNHRSRITFNQNHLNQNQDPESHNHNSHEEKGKGKSKTALADASAEETQEAYAEGADPNQREGQDQKLPPPNRNGKPARSATQAKPAPGSAAPPPTLADFAAPLPDALYESLAQELYERAGNMPVKVARFLVATYGMSEVRTALNLLAQQPPGEIGNPGGWLRSVIEPRRADANESPRRSPAPPLDIPEETQTPTFRGSGVFDQELAQLGGWDGIRFQVETRGVTPRNFAKFANMESAPEWFTSLFEVKS